MRTREERRERDIRRSAQRKHCFVSFRDSSSESYRADSNISIVLLRLRRASPSPGLTLRRAHSLFFRLPSGCASLIGGERGYDYLDCSDILDRDKRNPLRDCFWLKHEMTRVKSKTRRCQAAA